MLAVALLSSRPKLPISPVNCTEAVPSLGFRQAVLFNGVVGSNFCPLSFKAALDGIRRALRLELATSAVTVQNPTVTT
jgi:hypothetical protein